MICRGPITVVGNLLELRGEAGTHIDYIRPGYCAVQLPCAAGLGLDGFALASNRFLYAPLLDELVLVQQSQKRHSSFLAFPACHWLGQHKKLFDRRLTAGTGCQVWLDSADDTRANLTKERFSKDAVDAFRLLRAFRLIRDRVSRHRVVETVEVMAAGRSSEPDKAASNEAGHTEG
ncbi:MULTISPECIES: hypothetical protein [Bradyrhizobium]|uniref:Uncharacterized protein n=1 Tax=Bradyrhizobium brasilense TaxID=1419277 RepID=A0ABY8JT18_9BRAD|nr:MULTISPECIES: hypothetical protein [Bradyrhizobium]WFU66867.1 hypothetical protein QA636_15830 [Bradyrhizobium brasilense]